MQSAPDPDRLSRILMLVFGQMRTPGNYWAYVAVKPTRYDEFQQAMNSRQYNMQDFEKDGYGEVVVSGTGANPPRDVTKQVAQMFEIPITQLFADANPKAIIANKMEELRRQADQS